jgi:hypothetical protein
MKGKETHEEDYMKHLNQGRESAGRKRGSVLINENHIGQVCKEH